MRGIELPEVLVLFGILVLLAFALVLLAAALRWKQSRSVQRALIDKIPANEIPGLLQTPPGQKLMQALSEAGGSPGRSIITSVHLGIVVIVSGVGLAVAAGIMQAPVIVLGMAVMLISLGTGLVVAAFLSYRLARRWNLLEETNAGHSNSRAD